MLIWCRSAVNFSFLVYLAACCMRPNACDTLSRSCAQRVLCWSTFPLVPALCSTGSAADRSALFVGLIWRRPTFHARASPASAPCLPDADRCQAWQPVSRLPTSSAFLLRVTCSQTFRQDGNASHNGVTHVAFDYFHGLGSCDMPYFVAQSKTPRNRCVRFVAGVAVGSRITLTTGRPTTALPQTGLSPVWNARALAGAFGSSG